MNNYLGKQSVGGMQLPWLHSKMRPSVLAAFLWETNFMPKKCPFQTEKHGCTMLLQSSLAQSMLRVND